MSDRPKGGSPEGGASRVPARSAQRALSVLVLISNRVRPVPASTIARELDIPKSSLHNLLNTMLDAGFVTYYEDEHAWGLGIRAFEIGSAFIRSEPLQRLGRPVLARLTESVGETSHLAILHGADVLYIDKQQAGGSAPQLVTEIGVRLPAHLTAVGRAIIAGLSRSQVKAIFANQPFVKRTGRGPTSVLTLMRELEEETKAGVAIESEFVTPGITCIAAPVRTREGVILSAVGISVLSAKYDHDEIERLSRRVKEAGAGLSYSLGYNGATPHSLAVA